MKGPHLEPRWLSIVALCLCTACGAEANVRPTEVPKLERIELGETVTLRLADDGEVDLSDYEEVRLFPASGGAGYRLVRPLHVLHTGEGLWLQSGQYAPVPFDPSRYSRAVIVYGDRGRGGWIAGAAVLTGFVLVGTGALVLVGH